MMTEVFYIDINRQKRNTAGAKAPDDIAEICRRNGFHRIEMPMYPSALVKPLQKLWLLTVCIYHWYKAMCSIPKGCVVLYQHPQYGVRVSEKVIPLIRKRKRCKFICVIHDLESLRGGIKGVIKANRKTNEIADDMLLRHMDCLICHNEYMREYLISRGYSSDRLVCLGLFDYLIGNVSEELSAENENSKNKVPIAKLVSRDKIPSIAIAGNLAIGKCKYIYDICAEDKNRNLIIHLFGNNYNEENASGNMIWHGSFKPDELPMHLTGDFGLVWDGNSADTCAGNTGAYLRYNNPHKTSLYLACGMPVIVWKEAAIADFVLENHVGIAVESLNNLDEAINEIDEDAYRQMCENAKRIGQKLRDGQYFKAAMERALTIVS